MMQDVLQQALQGQYQRGCLNCEQEKGSFLKSSWHFEEPRLYRVYGLQKIVARFYCKQMNVSNPLFLLFYIKCLLFLQHITDFLRLVKT